MKHIHRIEAGLLVLLVVAVALCGVLLMQGQRLTGERDASHVTNIPLEDCAVSEETIDDYLGVRRTYSFTLPSDFTPGDSLILYVSNQYCTVKIDGAVRFQYVEGAPRFIRTSGRYWAHVRLSAADAGKAVDVQLTPVFHSVVVPQARICPLDRMISDVLTEDTPLLILGTLCMVQGLTLFVIALFTFPNRRTKRALLCLAILTIEAGVWKIASLPVMTLLFRDAAKPLLQPKALYLYGMIAFLLMPTFIVQFLNGMRRSVKAVPDMLCAILTEATAVVVLALQLFGILELQSAVPFLMVSSAVLMLFLFYLILRQRDALWLISFPITACADLLITLLNGRSRYAILLMLCIMVNDYVNGTIFARNAIRQASELRDARASALMNQIQPHFIHNALTSIYYLCDSDPQTAKQLVKDFNSHLRANFTSLSVKTPIPFPEELEHVRAYLSVEQVRFSDKLFVEYDTPHTAFRLPALTLQPLVENAVKHNVDSGKPPVHIRIRTFACDGGSTVVIEDDGSGTVDTPNEHAHVGLQNVADRLQMLCDGTLRVEQRPEGGCVVTVFVPDEAKNQ